MMIRLSSILCFLCLIPLAGYGQITSEEPLQLPSDHIATDFNRDGIEDLVYTVNDTVKVVTRIGVGVIPQQQRTIPNPGTIRVGDINGDGYPEITFAHNTQLRYIENQQGVFGNTILLGQSTWGYEFAEVFDYQNDGDGDLALYNGFHIEIMINEGGSLNPDSVFSLHGYDKKDAYGKLKVCDYNQDGNQDLLLYRERYGLFYHLNKDRAEFRIANEQFNVRFPSAFDMGDFDGDGFPEIVQVYRDDYFDTYGKLRIGKNTPFFHMEADLMEGITRQSGIDIVDLNQDGTPEIVIADHQSISVVYYNYGVFTRVDLWGQQDTSSISSQVILNVEDYDDDGKLEILHAVIGGESRLFRTDYLKSGEEYTCQPASPPAICPPGDFYFLFQESLQKFSDDYPLCKVLNGDVTVSALYDLSPLHPITEVAGNLTLEWLDDYTIDFPNLEVVRGDLNIRYSYEIESLSLENLDTIEGRFSLSDNYYFYSIPALPNLATVKTIEMRNNELLTSIEGFPQTLASQLDSMIITGNLALSVCHTPLICEFMKQDGSLLVNNNEPGCNSYLEVFAGCHQTPIDSEEDEDDGGIIVDPTPILDDMDFGPDDPPAFLLLYGADGRLLLRSKHVSDFNLQERPSGIYNVFAVFENKIRSKRILVQ